MSVQSTKGNKIEKNRIAYWDNIKFVMITLVVIGHFVDTFTDTSDVCKSIFLFIYAFHMPVLLFISGLFYNIKNHTRKIVYFISGGFAIKIFYSIMYLIIDHHTGFSLLSDSSIPWFFFVLAFYQIIMFLLKDVDKSYLLICSVLLACFVGYDQSIGDFLYLSRTIVFFPFFLTGTMLKQKNIIDLIKRYYKILFPIAVFIVLVWLYLSFFRLESFYKYRYLFTGRNAFWDEIIKYGPVARLFCYIVSVLTGASIMILIPRKRVPFFTRFGSHTENVYFWHCLLYFLMIKYLSIEYLFMMSIWGKVCFILIAILLSVILSAFNIFNYPLSTIRRQCFKVKNSNS